MQLAEASSAGSAGVRPDLLQHAGFLKTCREWRRAKADRSSHLCLMRLVPHACLQQPSVRSTGWKMLTLADACGSQEVVAGLHLNAHGLSPCPDNSKNGPCVCDAVFSGHASRVCRICGLCTREVQGCCRVVAIPSDRFPERSLFLELGRQSVQPWTILQGHLRHCQEVIMAISSRLLDLAETSLSSLI